MREKLPPKGPGKRAFSRSEYEKFRTQMNRTSSAVSGSNVSGLHTGSFSGHAGFPPHSQTLAYIVGQSLDCCGEPIPCQYDIYLCAYNYTSEIWELIDEKIWWLDLSSPECDCDSLDVVDTYLTVFWDELRGMFRPVVFDCGSATSTSTTPNPTDQSCQGSCKFVWSASSKVWNRADESTYFCGPTTTTTSTTTTSTTTNPDVSTTSTTQDPACPCTSSTTTTSSSTTPDPSTSSTSSSTTPDPCQCGQPSYCGTTDGECTIVDCISTNLPSVTPNCSSTTVDPGSSTTPQPCTSSSTTLNPTECSDCSFVGCGPIVIELYNNCSGQCICPGPTDLTNDCTPVVVPCVKYVPPPPPVPVCEGQCNWICVYGSNSWVSIGGGGCSRGRCASCLCAAPTGDCNPCDTTTTYCEEQCPGDSTSSTTTVDPCASTTTSTSPDPCKVGRCKWQAACHGTENPCTSLYWDLIESSCLNSCICQAPIGTPDAICQTTQNSCCNDSTCPSTTTSTSTTTTTTTTTTTSTSTTPSPLCGAPGTWQWKCYDYEYCDGTCQYGFWTLVSLPSDSILGCHCCLPTSPGNNTGEQTTTNSIPNGTDCTQPCWAGSCQYQWNESTETWDPLGSSGCADGCSCSEPPTACSMYRTITTMCS